MGLLPKKGTFGDFAPLVPLKLHRIKVYECRLPWKTYVLCVGSPQGGLGLGCRKLRRGAVVGSVALTMVEIGGELCW